MKLIDYIRTLAAALWLLARVLVGACNLRDEQHALGLDC
jgi:hypothetical protein